MADEAEKYRIPLFDGTNYSNWKFRIETLLNEMDLLIFVERNYVELVEFTEDDTMNQRQEKIKNLDELKKKDRKCKSQIIQRIADSHLEYVKDKATAFDLWKSLQETFERKGIASQLLIRKSLLTMKFNANCETLACHFLKFDKLIRELRSTGANIVEADVVCHLLLTMPPEYETVVTALETLAIDTLTPAFVKNRLMDEECKRKDGFKRKGKIESQSSSVFSSHTSRAFSGAEQKKNKTNKFLFKCYNCGIQGHKRSECNRNIRGKQNYRSNNSANMATNSRPGNNIDSHFCFPATTLGNYDGQIKWILDSGATEHLVSGDVPLENVKELERPMEIKVAKSGIYLHANKIGEIEVRSRVNEKEFGITIKDVLLVPGLQYNLLSVRKLESNGFRVTFENGKGLIQKGNCVAAVAYRNESQLYVLSFECRNTSATLCTPAEDFNLWHKRLGHLNVDSVKKLQGQVDGINVDLSKSVKNICETCIEGKQAQQPHNQKRVRAKRPLQLIHSDLMGPISPTSYDDKKYILTFIDDFTHFTAAYIMESKSEVPRYFKVFEAMATAHFNMKISRFRCDNGREYISNEMKNFFEGKGIQFEYTIRYTPQQNGVAERMNRTIIEKSRCMILNSKLGKKIWSEAVLAAVYLINRSPTSALNGKLPAALWYNERPDLKKLRIFGCVAYLKIPKELSTGKFESRSKKCFFTGYCSNGYRLWCPEDNKIILGKNVIFDENKFSFESMTSEEWIYNDESHINDNYKSNENDVDETEDSKEDVEVFHDIEEFISEPENSPILRRSTRTTLKPKYLSDYAVIALNAEAWVNDVPDSFEDIETREDRQQWKQAVQEEINSLMENNTWELTSLPPGKRLIENKWIFKIKYDKSGDVDRYKARLVVKGCVQRKGFDYEETYAPVARLTTLRTLLSIINEEDLIANQMDVKNAFLHGDLKEEIYMKVPSGVENKDNLVCKLKKALYGLKQAPRAWNETFDKFISTTGLKRSNVDKCLYVGLYGKLKIYLLLYVDDILIAGTNQRKIDEIKEVLKTRFHMKDLGKLQTFLGINIERSDEKLHLSQPIYLRKLLTRFNMEECKVVNSPMECKPTPPEDEDINIKTRPYQELIGCLMYAMLTTRPDLSVAVNYYSRYQNCQTETLWKGLKRLLRYIKGTLDLGLCFQKGGAEVLSCYADADFGSESDRKSTSGFLMKVCNNTVVWSTRRQLSVALSSTEAEYIALAMAAAELQWLMNLLKDMLIPFEIPVKIYEDNQSCIHLLERWEHRRLKHIDIKYNFVRDLREKGLIHVTYIGTKDQIADILTKALSGEQFVKLRAMLGLTERKLLN